MGISTWCLRVKQKCWCVVALLVSLVQTRTFATGVLPATPVEWTMWCRGGKNGLGHFCSGSSGDQSLVENAKTEITRVEKQMRRFSRWLLRRRIAMWLEELEEGIRKQDAFTVYRYARLLAGTGIGRNTVVLDKFEPTPFLRLNGHKVWQKKDQRVDLLCTISRGTTSDESNWNYRTLVTVKRRRCIERRLEQIMLAL